VVAEVTSLEDYIGRDLVSELEKLHDQGWTALLPTELPLVGWSSLRLRVDGRKAYGNKYQATFLGFTVAQRSRITVSVLDADATSEPSCGVDNE